MNIFYTNENPRLAARDHCTIHTNKMIIEYAQLLSTAHHMLDGYQAISGIYKLTHKNHPSTIWVRSGQYQYEYVLDCALELCRMYKARTGKTHKTQTTLEILQVLPANIPLIDWTEPPLAMPAEYKKVAIFEGKTKAYQAYLLAKFKEWQSRDKPLQVVFDRVPSWYV